jgi:hypothetical protein
MNLSIPTGVKDIDTLMAWLDTLSTPCRDVTEEEIRAGDGNWVSIGFGSVVTGETLKDDPSAREKAETRTAETLSFLLLGFVTASPQGVVWRVRPELRWKTDPITGNGITSAYVRLGTENKTLSRGSINER